MAVCEACGTDNRDKAKFCIGCARSLASSSETQVPAAVHPTGPVQVCVTCQTANPLASTVCKSCRTSLVPDLAPPGAVVNAPRSGGSATRTVVLAGLVLLLGAGAWLGLGASGGGGWLAGPGADVTSSSNAAAVNSPPNVLPSLTSTVAISQATVTATVPASTTEREQRAREERRLAALEKKRQQAAAKERAAAEERERLALAEERQRAERDAQQQAAQQAAARAQLAKASAPPPAPKPVVASVEQTCASSGNFFSREVCRFQACRDAAFASDPVCVRHREMEAANRRAVAN